MNTYALRHVYEGIAVRPILFIRFTIPNQFKSPSSQFHFTVFFFMSLIYKLLVSYNVRAIYEK